MTDEQASDLASKLLDDFTDRYQIRVPADICHPYAQIVVDNRDGKRICQAVDYVRARDLREALANGAPEADFLADLLEDLKDEEETLVDLVTRQGYTVGTAPKPTAA